jgi:hypothetical protein
MRNETSVKSNRRSACFIGIPTLILSTIVSAVAQSPFALLHSLFDPGTNVQVATEQGFSVALDGNMVVTGAPGDSLSSGAVRVYDATTWALLHTLKKPIPTRTQHFGNAVAISGTRLVVGADEEDAGAVHAGSAYVYDLASATPTVPWLTLTNPRPAAFDHFGMSVAISGVRVVIGSPGDTTGELKTGTAYVYDLSSATPAVPTITLTNPGPVATDQFGNSVAISETRVVVGAPYENTQAFRAGSVYVYDLASFTPVVPVTTLNNPTPAMNDQFGISVAISGARVIVGAWLDDTGASDAGSAYAYDLASATPTIPIGTLNNPSPSMLDSFGMPVAISGTHVVIGAKYDDTAAVNTGTAYVYDLASASPVMSVITVTNPSPARDDFFGFAVAISDRRMVVGAPRDDTVASGAGSAYVYDLADAMPTAPIAALNQSSPAVTDYFGTAVAISGTRMVVGAPKDDTGRRDAGCVYVYDLRSSTPRIPVATLANPRPDRDDEFGSTVAISGTRVVIGAYYSGSSLFGSGATYIYDLASTQPNTPATTLFHPGTLLEKGFGFAVGISGNRVAVGSGSKAYVYDLTSATPTVPVVTLTNPIPALNNYFGSSVAISGTRMVVGAHGDGNAPLYGGRAYVYDLASAAPATPVLALAKPNPALNDYFGYAVGIAGTHVVIGAPYDNIGANLAGTAWVYDLTGVTPSVPLLILTNPSPAEIGRFGNSVAISGTRMAVGVPGDDYGTTYVYDLVGDTPTLPVAVLTKPNPGESDGFGFCVAIDDTTIVAGTPFDDTAATDRGAAYVFGLQPVLSIVPTVPGFATLSWTSSISSSFVLQYANALAPTNWFNALSGEANPVTVSLTNGARFYRLSGP